MTSNPATLRQYYQVQQKLKALEAEKAALKDEIVSWGTGKRTIAGWDLNVNSFTEYRADLGLIEEAIGPLDRFKVPIAKVVVSVKLNPAAALDLLETA